MSLAFAIPPTARACLDLICLLRDGQRDAAWADFKNIVASDKPEMLSDLWGRLATRLALEVTPNAIPPCPHACRESADPISGRVAWRT